MKKTLSLFLSLVMIASVTVGLNITAQADSLPSSGWCGKNAKFTFDKSTGTLTISGEGKIKDSAFSVAEGNVKKLVIKNGITEIGEYAFCNFEKLSSITMPSNLKYVGDNAFWNTAFYYNSKNWKKHGLYYNKYLLDYDVEYLMENQYSRNIKVEIVKGTETIADGIFPGNNYSDCIRSIFIQVSVKNICGTFEYVNNLKDVYYEGNKSASKKIQVYDFHEVYNGLDHAVPNYATIRYGTATIPASKPKGPKITGVVGLPKAFAVEWKKASKVKGYQLQCSTDNAFKKNKKTITIKKAGTTSKYIKKLKSKKTYYIRIRSYKIKNNKKVYSAWSAKKKVKTK